MKRILAILFLLILFICNNISYASQTVSIKYSNNNPAKKHIRREHTTYISPMPVCTNGNLICTLGKYVFSSNNSKKPIYANFGIMCTTDGGICTNGEYIIRSNQTIYQ